MKQVVFPQKKVISYLKSNLENAIFWKSSFKGTILSKKACQDVKRQGALTDSKTKCIN